MNPSELMVDVVRDELASIIERYPDNTGALDLTRVNSVNGEESIDPKCVYFTDERGVPITSLNYDLTSKVVFAKPICIIGTWIDEFHPNFKEHNLIRMILVENSTVRSLRYLGETAVFNPDVHDLLVHAQDTQDSGNGAWSDIDLNAVL